MDVIGLQFMSKSCAKAKETVINSSADANAPETPRLTKDVTVDEP